MYGLRVPAACVLCVPEAQGRLPGPGRGGAAGVCPRVRGHLGVRACACVLGVGVCVCGGGGHGHAYSLGRAVRTAYRGTPGGHLGPNPNSDPDPDQVATSDGHTYERREIFRWLCTHDTSPLTGATLPNKALTPAIALRQLIAAFVAENSE